MTGYPSRPKDVVPQTWVAIDVAKHSHIVLIESPAGRRQLRIANQLEDLERLVTFLREQPTPVRIGFEPTGVYHRALAYRLVMAGFDLLVRRARRRPAA